MKIILPAQNEPIALGGGPVNPTWYEKLKFLEKLQPLSDIPPAPPSVTSIDGTTGAFTIGYAISRAGQALSAGLTSLTNSLGADVALNNTANYFDGPSVAQGSTGTWFVSGTVTMIDTSQAAHFDCKLWDGTTVIASARTTSQAINAYTTIALSGFITSPAGNLKISCKNATTANGQVKFNITGNSKDSTITAVRIA